MRGRKGFAPLLDPLLGKEGKITTFSAKQSSGKHCRSIQNDISEKIVLNYYNH